MEKSRIQKKKRRKRSVYRRLARLPRLERGAFRLGVSIDDCYGVLQKALQCPRNRLNTGVPGFLNVIWCSDFGLCFEVLLAGY